LTSKNKHGAYILAHANVEGLGESYLRLNNYISDLNLDGNEYVSVHRMI